MNRYLRLHDPIYTDERPQDLDNLLILDRPDEVGDEGVVYKWSGGKRQPIQRLQLLGQGSFKCAYLQLDKQGKATVDSKVVIVVSDLKPDYNMACFEYINRHSSSVHIPKVKLVGFTNLEAVYTMPRYIAPIPPQNESYQQFRAIEDCWEEAQDYLDNLGYLDSEEWDVIYQGDVIRKMTIECIQVFAQENPDRIPKSVLRAITLIEEAVAKIGDTKTLSFDFHDENFATDQDKRLIFLDPLLDLEVLNYPEEYAEKEGFSEDEAILRMACVDEGEQFSWF